MPQKLIVEIITDATAYTRGLGKAQAQTARFSATVSRSATSVARSLGILGAGFGAAGLALRLKNATSAAAEFNKTMQQIVGLAGVSQSKIAGLSQAVQQLAPQVGKGPEELAKALYFINSSGISAAHSMDVLKVSAKAAAAGLGETQTVADAVTSVMNAYGPSVVSAGKATDVLVATVREGKGEATDFAGVIGNVTAIASQLGVSFNDVGAALAGMTKLGTDARTSATQLQQIFTALLKTTPRSEKAFKSVGLSVADLRTELKSRGLLAALTTIKTAFAGNLPALSKAFGNIRALRGVLALVGSQAKSTEGIFNRLNRSAGSLDTAFKAVSKTPAFQFERLNAALKDTEITIGSVLAPVVAKIAKRITDWLSVSENQRKVQLAVERGVKTLSNTIQALVGFLKNLRDTLTPVVQEMGGLQNAVKALLAAFVVSKIVPSTQAISLLGKTSEASGGKVNLLRASLLRLGAIGVITIGVEILLNKDAIDKKVTSFLQKNHAGFLTSQKQKIPLGVDVTDLDKAAVALGNIYGKSSLAARGLRKVADSLRAASTAASQGIAAASSIEANRGQSQTTTQAAGTIGGAIQKAIDAVQQQADAAVIAARKAAAKQKAAGAKAAAAAKKAAEAQRKSFDDLIASLQLNIDKAAATKGFKDDLAANAALQAAIRKQISVEGKTTDLEQQLFDAQQARAQIIQARAQAAADARRKAAEAAQKASARLQAQQFKSLGLTGTGEAITPGTENLKKQLAQLTSRLGPDITPKIKAQLARVGRTLAEFGDSLKQPVRAKIKELFDTIRSTFSSEANKGPLTKTSALNTKKIVEGLGLGPDAVKEIRARLSKFNTAGLALSGSAGTALPSLPAGVSRTTGGGAPLVVQMQFDSRVVAAQVVPGVTVLQDRKKRRNPAQVRGVQRHGI